MNNRVKITVIIHVYTVKEAKYSNLVKSPSLLFLHATTISRKNWAQLLGRKYCANAIGRHSVCMTKCIDSHVPWKN